jgi:hypothetical protein
MKTKKLVYIGVAIIAGALVFIVVKSISPKYYVSKDYRWYSELTPKDKNLLIRGKKIDRRGGVRSCNQTFQKP